MIFLHTTPDPTSPFWLLHLESLTLAKLILLQGGPHILHVESSAPSCNIAFKEFAITIEGIRPDASKGLTMIDHQSLANEIPTTIVFAPLIGNGFAVLQTANPRMALAYIETTGPIGPVWKIQPDPNTRLHRIRHSLALARKGTRLDLGKLFRSNDIMGLWLNKPDELATI